jgi:hypothetical protein
MAEERARENPCALRPGGSEFTTWLPVWEGLGPSSDDSNGEVRVSVGDDSTAERAVGPEQEAAYRRVIDRANETQRVILDAIAAEYPRLVLTAEQRGALPKKVDSGALKNLVSLTAVHIQWAHRDGVAYVGYELACVWDAEHGLGALTHLDRVVAVGRADTAFLGWIADRDLQTPKARKAKAGLPARKKPSKNGAKKK